MKSKKTNKSRTLRGQAAMEYLMTYGWAILVIVIVIAALLFLNPFKVPETCLFQQPGFTCSDVKPLAYVTTSDSNVKVKFTLANKLGNGVYVYKVACSTGQSGNLEFANTPGFVPPTKDAMSLGAGQSKEYLLSCYDASNNALTSVANSELKSTVAVWYSYSNDPDAGDPSTAIERLSTATLVTTILKG